MLLSGVFAVQPIRDAAAPGDVAEAYLDRPLSYVAIAPLSNALDMLTLMSIKQHISMAASVLVLFALWRVFRAWRGTSTWRAHAIASVVLLFGIVVTYGAVAALPRPMAALITHDAHVLRVDFHSHTSASHDGRAGFNAERNRAWHRAAGFDVAYITDHGTVAGAERGMANNPNPAADGVTLLQGMEVTWTGEHVAVLGAQRTYRGIFTENLRDIDEQSLALASLIEGREPVVIWNHPRALSRLRIAGGPGTAGVRGIEIVNGAPDGMDDVRPKRAEIAQLAQRNNLALTGGTDNHGWGRTAPAWTLMRIFGWRGMHGDSLAMHIENAIREAGVRGTKVVERRVADPGASRVAPVFTIVAAPARMLTTISNDERVAWLIWVWLVWAGATWNRRRRARATA